MKTKTINSNKAKIIKAILTGNRQKAVNEVSKLPKAKKYHRITLIRDSNGFYQDSGIGKLYTESEANELIKDYTHSFIIL